jgi:hypothetical protein
MKMCVAQEDRGNSRVRTTRRVSSCVIATHAKFSPLFFPFRQRACASRCGSLFVSSRLSEPLNPLLPGRSRHTLYFEISFSSHSFVTVAYDFC